MSSPDSQSQRAYQILKRKILDGGYGADDVLSERSLAEECGVSRSPLRSAIARLEQEDVLCRLANGALVARPVTVIQLLEIVQTRRILEGAAAERAAALYGLTPELKVEREHMSAYLDKDDWPFDTFWDSDNRFHAGIALAARLTLLPGILDELRAVARRCSITRTHDRFTQQAREHLAVIDHIERRDPAGARRAMEEHFDSARARFLEWLDRA
ncbi:GntR family transcriptional regulator [Roseospira marina]|uniref:GntR family transcriptional regulator n=1 Tax=Roseospira marina TaxID=140057 RepID=A0A5M6IGZ2_9PROT|nr:GntR family transcriptional regulator [Roseospira marina]KAA5607571.1 GntR family transcriptional regulator [Roseospira marina]MBB4312238.1 DNA-binding GntR family transcriptional regulator [Roseospira marina]MBB5085746.1 DNA-binding GntR family transcriptional regulator [Roseospira marina]